MIGALRWITYINVNFICLSAVFVRLFNILSYSSLSNTDSSLSWLTNSILSVVHARISSHGDLDTKMYRSSIKSVPRLDLYLADPTSRESVLCNWHMDSIIQTYGWYVVSYCHSLRVINA